ncbi:MAG: lipoprotein insertase outer membrane protein LolB [Undibacterium sp.]|uniref:lipoprotein insertase outer membrane protein LolB n=1 Tax=Undibacterium sp. TaxID=1914977 RepID=UPI00271CDBBC|nr:lipoprotein insertase outer membrane protein LolB [Undibacterium sp.]MDO8651122.1 lipoprotein insertase outer membrane protein LolB [Undibacterium sp.]
MKNSSRHRGKAHTPLSIGTSAHNTHINNAQTDSRYGYSRFFVISTCLISSLFFTACSTIQRTSSATSTAADDVKISSIRQYQEQLLVSGRIQVQYQQNGKTQSLPGSFEWQQNKDDTSINLISPLGQTIASIRQNADGASLQQANQALRSADNLDNLLNEALGWSLPVTGLRDWLQGFTRTADGLRAPIATQDNLQLKVDGWQLRYVSWQDEAGQLRPKRIDLQRYTAQAGEVSMRIVIDQWSTP